jgi:hypothetical protein
MNASWWVGAAYVALQGVLTVAVMTAVIAHRVRPWLALSTTPVLGIGLALGIVVGYNVNGWIFLPAAIAVFGATAYGSRGSRWAALGLSVVAALVLFIAIVGGTGIYYGVGLGYVLGQGLWLIAALVIVMLPWVLGELVRDRQHAA